MRRREVIGLGLALAGGLAPAVAAPTLLRAPVRGDALDVRVRRFGRGARGALVAFHGMKRDAEAMLEHAGPLAEALRLDLYAPYFDEDRFPVWRYQRAGVTRDGKLQPRSRWTGPVARDLFAWIGERATGPVYAFGHSAGAQFLSRLAAYMPEAVAGLRRIVVANPSAHVAPTLDERPAYGFRGLVAAGKADAVLQAHLARPLTLYLGDEDTGDEDLVTSAPAMRQGATRLARGRAVHAMAQALSAERGWPLAWRKVEAEGVGHSAADMLSHPAAEQALR